MTNNMVIREKATPAVQNRSQVLDAELSQYYPAYDEVRTGKLVDEVIAAIKETAQIQNAQSLRTLLLQQESRLRTTG